MNGMQTVTSSGICPVGIRYTLDSVTYGRFLSNEILIYSDSCNTNNCSKNLYEIS